MAGVLEATPKEGILAQAGERLCLDGSCYGPIRETFVNVVNDPKLRSCYDGFCRDYAQFYMHNGYIDAKDYVSNLPTSAGFKALVCIASIIGCLLICIAIPVFHKIFSFFAHLITLVILSFITFFSYAKALFSNKSQQHSVFTTLISTLGKTICIPFIFLYRLSTTCWNSFINCRGDIFGSCSGARRKNQIEEERARQQQGMEMETGTQGRDLEMNVLNLTPPQIPLAGSHYGEGSSGAGIYIGNIGGDKAGKSD